MKSKRVCVYQFTKLPESRYFSLQKDTIETYARVHNLEICKSYIDTSTKDDERIGYKTMIDEIEQYDAILIRDLFSINKYTNACFKEINSLNARGLEVIVKSCGSIQLKKVSDLFEKQLKVVFYHSSLNGIVERKFSTQKKIVELFCKEKSKWTIEKYVYDEAEKATTSSQPNLLKLADEMQEYDLLVVSSLSRINLRSARFEMFRNRLNCNIYSLQEGFLLK